MTVDVLWYSDHEEVDPWEQWDSGLLKLVFDGRVWPSDFEFRHHHIGPARACECEDEIGTRAVVVVPARHHASPEDVASLNEYLEWYRSVLLILIGDEEAIFPWKDVKHPNIRFWVMMPDPLKHADMKDFGFFIGNGYHEETRDVIKELMQTTWGVHNTPRSQSWVFAGQGTHARRKQAVNGLVKASRHGLQGTLAETQGFAQGLTRKEYLSLMMGSKTCPAPSGPHSPDTFRFYEALECGSIPIADATTPTGMRNYWEFLYRDYFPFVEMNDWETVGGIIESEAENWTWRQSRAMEWWMHQKRKMVKRLDSDLKALGLESVSSRQVTVLVSSSPIPSHPSLEILEETLNSVWRSMDCEPEVIIMLDGVRPEQEHLRAQYEEYVAEVCWRCLHHWNNVIPLISPSHLHQAAMTRWAMDYVDTPTILFMEHDAPLVIDEPIDWHPCLDIVEYGAVDVLRFHHEARILEDHEHLMLDHETRDMLGVPVRRTRQWSQRAHLARSAYYRKMLLENFSSRARCFIEDRVHSVAQSRPDEHRIAIYHPGTGNIKRSYTTDGRAGGPKFDAEQVW